jgi:hypothetical protein
MSIAVILNLMILPGCKAEVLKSRHTVTRQISADFAGGGIWSSKRQHSSKLFADAASMNSRWCPMVVSWWDHAEGVSVRVHWLGFSYFF